MSGHPRPLLRFRGVQIHFKGITALDLPTLDINHEAAGGDLFLILGPNGAGKSSLVAAVTGFTSHAASGQIFIENGSTTELTSLSRTAIVRAGVARTFQAPIVFSSLTVRESLILASIYGDASSWFHRMRVLLEPARADRRIEMLVTEMIGAFRLEAVADLSMSELSMTALRRAELARALVLQPRLLFLDEPSAGADESEVDFLASFVTTGLSSLVTKLNECGSYRFPRAAVGLITHDVGLLRKIALSSSADPPVLFLEQGQLKKTSTLRRWIESTSP